MRYKIADPMVILASKTGFAFQELIHNRRHKRRRLKILYSLQQYRIRHDINAQFAISMQIQTMIDP
mgnify:FL=1